METIDVATEEWIDIRPGAGGLHLHVRRWSGERQPFVLLHGLASNAQTWTAVARHLHAAGHTVAAVDQRGHGRSDKADEGYDFATISEDLALLLDVAGLGKPIIAGQSWGGNVVLDFAARYPARAAGLVLVDGGYIDLQSRPNAEWDEVAVQLRPPPLAGMPRTQLKARIQAGHPDWSDEGLEATLGNFETLPDGTVRPWLALENHMRILRAMWEQRPAPIYPLVTMPVLLAVAEDDTNPEWMALKRRQVAMAMDGLPNATLRWFPGAAHDIHVHQPAELAALMLEWSAQI
jgi:pimeloyl-ACP methyl ester carboxylesterase